VILASVTPVYNSRLGTQERVARLLRMYANKRERLERAGAGDIVAVTGLKDFVTGDTLCPVDHPIRLETITSPEPVLTLAVEPPTMAEQEKLQFALQKLGAEDPTLQVAYDEERGQTMLSGMGELHLEVLVRRLADEFNVQVRVGKPQVIYRETIQGEAEVTETFAREIAGKPQYASVQLAVRPAANGTGVTFVNLLPEAGVSPPEMVEAVHQGVLMPPLLELCRAIQWWTCVWSCAGPPGARMRAHRWRSRLPPARRSAGRSKTPGQCYSNR